MKSSEAAHGSTQVRYTEDGLADAGSYSITCPGNAAVTRNDANSDTGNMYVDFNCTANPNAVTLHSLNTSDSDVALPIGPLLTTGTAVSVAIGTARRRIRKR